MAVQSRRETLSAGQGRQFREKGVLERIKEETKDISKVELDPKLEGRQAVMILTPEDKK